MFSFSNIAMQDEKTGLTIEQMKYPVNVKGKLYICTLNPGCVFVLSTYESSHLHFVYYKKWNVLKTIERIDMKFSGDNEIQVLNRMNPPLAPLVVNPNRPSTRVHPTLICK